MDDIQGLLSQFEPTQADRDAARRQAQMQFFLGLLGAPKGGEFQRIGQSGLLAMNNYQNQIKAEQAQRMQNIQAAAAVQEMRRRQQFADALTGGSMPAGAPAPMPSGGANVVTTPLAPQGGAPAPMAAPARKSIRDQLLDMGIPDAAIMAAANSKDPVAAINDLVKEFSKPVFGQGNIPILRGRNNQFTANPAAGYNEALAAQEAMKAGAVTSATEQAKQPYTLQSMSLPGGGTQQLYGDQLQQFLRGNNGLPMQGAGRAPSAAEQDVIPVPMGNGQTKMMTRADAARMFSQQAPQQMSAPTDAQALAMARAADKNGQPVDVTVNALGTTPNPAVMAQNTKIAEDYAKSFTDIVNAGRMAPNNIGKYQLMKNYLSKVDTGKAAPAVQTLKAYAAYVAPDLAKEWTGDVPYAQAAQALSNEIALQLRNPAGGAGMPGSLSNSDRQFLQSMTANVANDPRAIPMMLDARIALEKRSQDIAKLAVKYRRDHGTLDEGFEQVVQDFAERNPLFRGAPQPTASGDAPLTPQEQAELQRLRKRFGRQ